MLSHREIGKELDKFIRKLPAGVRLHQMPPDDGLNFVIESALTKKKAPFEIIDRTSEGVRLAVENAVKQYQGDSNGDISDSPSI